MNNIELEYSIWESMMYETYCKQNDLNGLNDEQEKSFYVWLDGLSIENGSLKYDRSDL